MKLSKSDFIFLGISFVILTLFSLLLYLDFNKKIEVSGVQQIGTITFKREVAQRRYSSQVVWEDVEQHVPVYNNDYIRTSEASEAVIHLTDGSEINIDEVSMIQISLQDGKGININFDHGSMSAKRNGLAGGKLAAINIKSKNSSISIDDSDIQLTRRKDEKLDLTVSKGSASVSTGGEKTVVNVNEKALISAGDKTRIVKLKFNLLSPSMNKRLFSESKKQEVNFKWDTSGRLGKYRIEISRHRNFKKILARSDRGMEETWQRQFSPGGYFWRVSAINSTTNKREFSEPAKFNIIYHGKPKLVSPTFGKVLKNLKGKMAVNFKWTKDSFAKDYVVELSSEPDFSSIVKRISTKRSNISISGISQGKYFWRVKRVGNDPQDDKSSYSKRGSFSVSNVEELAAPVLIRPEKNSNINILDLKSEGMVFSWSGNSQVKNFKLEISKDSKFSSIVKSFEVRGNYRLIKENFAAGKYFCRVMANVKGRLGRYSEATPFEVVSGVELEILGGEKRDFVLGKKKSEKVVFAWKSNLQQGKFRLDVSKDPLFKKLESHVVSGKKSKILNLSGGGQYYWRVVALGKNNKAIATSKTGSVLLQGGDKQSDGKKATLVVLSPVRKSKIFINSKFVGYRSVRREVEASKNLKLLIRTPGFRDYRKTLNLKEGETYNVNPTLINRNLLSRVYWTRRLGVSLASSPVSSEDKIVVATRRGVLKVISHSGNVLFSKSFDAGFESTPVIKDNRIFIVDVMGLLRAISIDNGRVIWQKKLSGPLILGAKPIIRGDYIYVANGYGGVECLELTGKFKWKQELRESIYSSPQIFRDKLIVVTDSTQVVGIDLSDGDIDWRQAVKGRVIGSAPKIWKNLLYFGTDAGFLYCVDPRDGDVNWKFRADGSLNATPLIIDNLIFFGSSRGTIYSLELASGKEVWKVALKRAVRGNPIYAFGQIILSDFKTVYSLSPDGGKLLWKKSFSSKIKTSPVISGKTVLVVLKNGEIVSLRGELLQKVH